MAGALSENIRKHYIDRAGGLARQCTALSTRQRVLLTQAVALAVREHFGGVYNLPTQPGRSGLLKYVELLHISDFRANDLFLEVRVKPSLEQDTMPVPT